MMHHLSFIVKHKMLVNFISYYECDNHATPINKKKICEIFYNGETNGSC